MPEILIGELLEPVQRAGLDPWRMFAIELAA